MSPHSRRERPATASGVTEPLVPEPAVVVPLLSDAGAEQRSGVAGELRLRGLVDALPDGLVIADEEGLIVYANRRLAELSGYSAAEMNGRPIELLVPERMRRLHEDHRDRFIAQPTARPMGAGLGILLRRKDGSEFPADISLSPLDTPGARVVLATIRDVTDRREAEERLRRSEERFRLMVEWVQDYAIVMLEPDGRLASWNLGAQRITGYSAEEMIGHNVAALYPPETDPQARLSHDLAIATREGRAVDEGWRVRKDGSRFWASVVLSALPGDGGDGAPRGFAKVIRDMTERRQSGARLEAINDVARAILENRDGEVLAIMAGRGRAMVDADLGAVVTPADPGTLVVREVDSEIGAPLRGLVISESGALAGAAMRSLKPVVTLDLTAETGLPGEISEATTLGPALFVPLATEERIFGTLVVGRRRGAAAFTEEDLRSLELFAAQASVALEHGRIRSELQRLAVVEDRERIARELHDGIVQALFAVGLGLLSVEPLAAEEPVRGRLREAVDSIDQVIADLRRYIFGLKPQAVGLETLGDAVATLAREFEGRTGIVTALDTDRRLDHAGGASTAEVIQVLREALSNVARHAAATTCRVSLRWEAPLAVLEVDDDGHGFDTAAIPGHGYGLANLRERAVAVGGSVEIASQPGQGTTVRLLFPVELVED
ncbi:MAG TPA: PAS domain S-box protein [Candidatus Angelobacter sp.]|jgi:PAS domain S-box-containing protein|nr:PAS domain S-box protein [Candidatus Angelobacter sp.]